MTEKQYFQIRGPYETVGELRASVSKIAHILKPFDYDFKLEDLPGNIVDDVIFTAEKTDLSLRCANENRKEMLPNSTENLLEEQPVEVSFDGKMLIVKTPLTLKRSGLEANDKHNYMLMNYARAALEKWQETHAVSLYKSIKWPVVAFIIRKGNGNRIRGICDNDNLENGRIINEIFSALGYSDNVRIMDVYSKYEDAGNRANIGTEFILVSKADKEAVESIIYRKSKS